MEGKYVLGIDIGGTFIKIAILLKTGEMIKKWSFSTNIKDHGEHILTDVSKSIKKELGQRGINKSSIIGAGIGVPGMVDKHNGLVKSALSIGWKNYPAAFVLSHELGAPVSVGNDANLAALGEKWRGAGQGVDDMFLFTLGTGVGGGILVNGKVIQGAIGSAGEIGHVTVENSNGFRCCCGKTGCLETVASATGMVRMAREAARQKNDLLLSQKNDLTSEDLFASAKKGNLTALHVIDKAMKYLGIAAANLANVLNPQKILIGGGVSGAGMQLMKPLQRYYREHALESVGTSTSLEFAALGNDAGVIGAARLAIDDIYREKGNCIYEQ